MPSPQKTANGCIESKETSRRKRDAVNGKPKYKISSGLPSRQPLLDLFFQRKCLKKVSHDIRCNFKLFCI